MNEILLYGGLVFAIALFLLSSVLFFTQDMAGVIKYYMKIKGKGISSRRNEPPAIKDSGDFAEHFDPDGTQLLNGKDDEQLLRDAQEFATALLEAEDSTQFLPHISDGN